MRKKTIKKRPTRKKVTKKSNTGKILLLLAGAYILFSSFRSKKLVGKPPLINQIDKPTGADQVYSKVGTKLYDKNKNVILTYEDAGLGMTVTAINGDMFSVVYGDTFQYGLPAYVNVNDVIITDPSEFITK
jgi:hypothetical protein